MTNQFVQLAPDGTGKKIDTTELTVAGQTVERQRVHLGGSRATGIIEPDMNNNLPVVLDDDDIFGTIVTGTRYNQIEASFVGSGPLSNILGLSVTGTGGSSIGSGAATFFTGTGTSATSQGATPTYVSYRPGCEIYCYFTASWTTPTSAASFQRIGIFDANNGFYKTRHRAATRSGHS